MSVSYNQIAGQNIERLAGLSDGIFAVAMTLLVLDLHTPDHAPIMNEAGLGQAILAMSPQIVTFLMSFLTLGIFWTGQQTALTVLARSDRNFTWIQIAFLATVSLMPFSTRLLAEYITYRTALLLYWFNLLALGMLLLAGWRYSQRAKLFGDDVPPGFCGAIERRILGGQALYAIGALLCVIDPRVSIGFIVLVQLNFAIAPKIRGLWRV